MEHLVFGARRVQKVYTGTRVGRRREGDSEGAPRCRDTRSGIINTFDGAVLGTAGGISADGGVPGSCIGFTVRVASDLQQPLNQQATQKA